VLQSTVNEEAYDSSLGSRSGMAEVMTELVVCTDLITASTDILVTNHKENIATDVRYPT
jgi:hypothetical protein